MNQSFAFAVVGGMVLAACGSFGSDSGADVDAGADASADGGPSSTPSIACEKTSCTPGAEVCCSGLPPSGMGTGCLARDAGPCKFGLRECDDGIDCSFASGTICCGAIGSDNVSVQEGSTCLTLGNCAKSSYSIVLCDPQAPQPCPENAKCTLPHGGNYAFCVGLAHAPPL